MDKEALEAENVELRKRLGMAELFLKDATLRMVSFKEVLKSANAIKWPNPENEEGNCYHCNGAQMYGGRRHETECEWTVFYGTLLKAEELMRTPIQGVTENIQ